MPKKKRRGSFKVVVEDADAGGSTDAAELAAAAAAAGGGEDELVFEDPYADDYESDGEVVDAAAEGEGEGDAEAAAAAAAAGEAVDALEEQLRVWRPGIDTLGEDEVGCPLSRRPSPRR